MKAMKRTFPRPADIAAFTIAEVLIAGAVASIILGGLMTGSIAIQRSFAASDRLARAQSDLHRVADYMARDIRNSTSVDTTATSSVLLTVTTGDYYDRRGTPGNLADDVPNAPVLGRTGASYGTNPVTIRYVRNGTRIARQVSKVDAGTTATATTWIADNVDALTVGIDANGTVTFTSATAMNYSRPKAGIESSSLSFVMASQPRNLTP